MDGRCRLPKPCARTLRRASSPSRCPQADRMRCTPASMVSGSICHGRRPAHPANSPVERRNIGQYWMPSWASRSCSVRSRSCACSGVIAPPKKRVTSGSHHRASASPMSWSVQLRKVRRAEEGGVIASANPLPGVVEEALPGRCGEAAGPGVLESEIDALGVRHEDEGAAVCAGDAGGAGGGARGIERVGLGGFAVGVYVAQGDEIGGWGEAGVAFAVGDDDGDAGVGRVLEEEGWGGRDFGHAEAGFKAGAEVAFKAGPVFGAGDDPGELGHHLAAVANAQGEGICALEEGRELFAEGFVKEDGFGPAGTCAEDVAVTETAAGGEAREVGERLAAGEEVAHVDVDGGEPGAVEGVGHLVLAVDALLAEDGDAGACDVEERRTYALGEVEGHLHGEAGTIGVVEQRELLGGAGRVVAEGGDVEAGLGPKLVQGGAGVAIELVAA